MYGALTPIESSEEIRRQHFKLLHSFWVEELLVEPIAASEGVAVRPRDHYFSGVTIIVDERPTDGSGLHLIVSQVDGLQVRSARLEHGQFAPCVDTHFFWQPIKESSGAVFEISLRSDRATSHQIPFSIAQNDGSDCLIYSSPESKLSVPAGIGFSPLTQCNLNCTHCISRFSRGSVSNLDDEIWQSLVEHIEAGRIIQICSDYSGDLLNSDRKYGWLRKMIDCNISFNIDTHANNLTPENTELLLASKMTMINFSVDSLEPEQYRQIRKGGDLETVLTNVRHFMKRRYETRPDVATIISFAMMKSTTPSLFKAVDLTAELRMHWVQGNHLMVFTADMIEESLLLDRPFYERFYNDLRSYAAKRNVTVSLPEPVTLTRSRRGHAPCIVPWNGAQILGNGDVMACCLPGTKMGNLRENTLEEIWNGVRMRNFRSRINTDRPPGPCSTCPMHRIPNNFASYAPGLVGDALQQFEQRVTNGRL